VQLGGKTIRAHHPDYVIALVIAILLAVGLVMMYSISPILSHKLASGTDRNYYFVNQIKYVAIGLVVWIAASSISYTIWRKWAPRLMIVAIVSLVALMVPALSHSANGATRWLTLGPLSIQPAEILKVAMILYLATWLDKRQEEIQSFWDGVVPFVIMVGAACFVVVVLQKDMGSMMVFTCYGWDVFYGGYEMATFGWLGDWRGNCWLAGRDCGAPPAKPAGYVPQPSVGC
jgi:cell division protein FtsW